MEYNELPPGLYDAIGSETRDFAVKSASLKPFYKSLPGLIAGVLWLAFFSLIFFGIFEFSISEMIAAGAAENKAINPAFYLIAFMGVFFFIGIFIIGKALLPLIRKGGYFVGTPDRLVHYRAGKVRSIDWEQFTGDMRVTGNERKGSILLVMKTGRIRHQKGGSIYIPDEVYLTSVPGVFEIEKICRKRISENDPSKQKKT